MEPGCNLSTICAFANDFDNTGGGYILVGVEEKNGHAVHPIKGISLDKIEPIEKEMRQNGSPAAEFDSDEARTYFLVNFPIHSAFAEENRFDPKNEAKFSKRQWQIITAIKADDTITRPILIQQCHISKSTIERELRTLKKLGILRHEGPSRSGKWIINEQNLLHE